MRSKGPDDPRGCGIEVRAKDDVGYSWQAVDADPSSTCLDEVASDDRFLEPRRAKIGGCPHFTSVDWRAHLKFKRTYGFWTDDDSDGAANNDGWQ